MGLFLRTGYVPLVRPKMHRDRLANASYLRKGSSLRRALELSGHADKFLNKDQETTQRAVDETAPYSAQLRERLLKAPDPIAIAAGKNFLYEATMGWAIAQIEVRKWGYRKGFTHPEICNGLVWYYSTADRDEFLESLILAIETGYYAARVRFDGKAESPKRVVSELY
ncbi:hypothetical protein [Streptomyces europaeiscabiei]|uniref:hypothetical protein n=1 Tax=Streptomyces europaeiscabiei TaxID=146819 RepID=UPI0029BD2438|nr:hypothetical protein [Streptomyces europaeiscabiei]MDX3831983.1 hypothetical protein [Streptomyces europaeiscabiei]